MTLTKQQKLDMIYDVELRLAKEELAEQYVKNMNALENSDKPLRTLQEIVHGYDRSKDELSQNLTKEAHVNPANFDNTFEHTEYVQQNIYQQTSEDKELLEQSAIAAKAPLNKSSLDSKSQWEFTGIETLARQAMAKEGFDLQDQFENAQSMSNDNDMGMEM